MPTPPESAADAGAPDGRPLAGRRVAVTRPGERAAGLTAALEALGAEVLAAPAIAVAPPASYAALDAALAAAGRYDWLALTSAAAVDAVADRLHAAGTTLPDPPRVAAVGRATAAAARARLGRVDLVPALHAADGLADALPAARGARVLFPCADRARDALPSVLRARGATVDRVVAYRTVDAPPEALAAVAACAAAGTLDAVVVASPSAAGALARACGGDAARLRAVCIGPTTADACRALGVPVAGVAAEPTDAALVAAVVHLVTSVSYA
jgi:uroporphyrinogen-III synthase